MSNKYSTEISLPTIPICPRSRILLQFNGHFLIMVSGPITHIYQAVSGKPTEALQFDYSSNRQHLSKTGPIPEGNYWIRPSQMWTNHWCNYISS